MNQKMLRLFGGALFLLCFCHGTLYAITKETAIDRCASNIEFLKKAPISFEDRELESVFQKILNRLVLTLDSLKKAEDPKEIYVHRTVCDNGYKAVQWVVENFSSVTKIQEDKKEDQQATMPHDEEGKNKGSLTPDNSTSKEEAPKSELNHAKAHSHNNAHSLSHQENTSLKKGKVDTPSDKKETSSDLVKNDGTVKNNKEIKKAKASKKKTVPSAKMPLKKARDEE